MQQRFYPSPPQYSTKRYWQLRIDSIFAYAMLFSILLHVLFIFFSFPNFNPSPLDVRIKTLNVRLVPIPNQAKRNPSPPQQASSAPEQIKPKPKANKPLLKKVLTSPSNNFAISISPAEKPVQERPANKEPSPESDMLAYLNARRQQAQTIESSERPASAPTNIQDRLVPEQKRDEIIARNLQQEGTSGLFQIREIAGTSAQFSFRGWQQNGRNSRFEIITVHADANETIERAIVRRMIAIIREHYSGDFNWQSHRYNRIIVLSANPKDNRALEDFLIQEFFAAGVR